MDTISALFDGVWTTMEDWGAATTFNYGIAVLIPIVIVLVLALVTKDTFVSFFAGIIAAFLMAAKGHPLMPGAHNTGNNKFSMITASGSRG